MTTQERITQYFSKEENQKTLFDYIKTVSDLETFSVYDTAHEIADSSQDVIYTGRAHSLVASASMEEEERAMSEAKETGILEGKDYNEQAVALAYFLTLERERISLEDEITDLIDHLEDFQEELEEEAEKVCELIDDIRGAI